MVCRQRVPGTREHFRPTFQSHSKMTLTPQQYADLIARKPHLVPKDAVPASETPQERSEGPGSIKVPPGSDGSVIGQKKRIRQGLPKQNRWELEWQLKLNALPHLTVAYHAMKLQLASGCWYEPDIVAWDINLSRLLVYEVKGFARDDAIVKLKVAARVYPWISFWLVWKDKGQWLEQPIRP